MPESLSVAFGAVLEALADDPWSVGSAFGPNTPARLATFGLSGRGMLLFTVHEDLETGVVQLLQITF